MFRNSTDLAVRVHRFNQHPADYAHLSWFEALIGRRLYTVLRSSRRAERRLSELLLQRYGLSDDHWYDFSPQRWRFALLPAPDLLKLVDYCGITFQHRRIAATVDRSARIRLVAQIGEAAFAFALKRAPLILGRWAGEGPRWDGEIPFGNFVRQSGTEYFLSHFHTAPTAIAARLAFKFPRDLACRAADKSNDSDGWPLFNRILKHELNPKWQTLFS
jgi:hypothetical protein